MLPISQPMEEQERVLGEVAVFDTSIMAGIKWMEIWVLIII
jgi:hypothetical protein